MIRHLTLTLLLSTTLQAQTHRPAPKPPTPKPSPQPTGPTLLFDTTAGRITCRLFDKEAPTYAASFAALAAGTKPWLDGETHQPVSNKPFFDGSALGGVTDGIIGGDRLGGGTGLAGPPVPTEKNPLTFDRPGILALARAPNPPRKTPSPPPPCSTSSSTPTWNTSPAAAPSSASATKPPSPPSPPSPTPC